MPVLFTLVKGEKLARPALFHLALALGAALCGCGPVDDPTPPGAMRSPDMAPVSTDPLQGLTRSYARDCWVSGIPPILPRLKLTRVLAGTPFTHPVQLLPVPEGDRSPSGRVIVVTQPGRIFLANTPGPNGT